MVNFAISVCKTILPISALQCVPNAKAHTTEVFAQSTLEAKTLKPPMEETGRQVQEDLEGEDLQLIDPSSMDLHMDSTSMGLHMDPISMDLHMDPTSMGLHMDLTSTCLHLIDLKGHQFQVHLRDPLQLQAQGHNKEVIYQYQVHNHKTLVLMCPRGQIHSRNQQLVLP